MCPFFVLTLFYPGRVYSLSVFFPVAQHVMAWRIDVLH